MMALLVPPRMNTAGIASDVMAPPVRAGFEPAAMDRRPGQERQAALDFRLPLLLRRAAVAEEGEQQQVVDRLEGAGGDQRPAESREAEEGPRGERACRRGPAARHCGGARRR